MIRKSDFIGLDERLRRMFDHIKSDPMPDHLLALVDQLEAARLLHAPREAQAAVSAEA